MRERKKEIVKSLFKEKVLGRSTRVVHSDFPLHTIQTKYSSYEFANVHFKMCVLFFLFFRRLNQFRFALASFHYV